MSLKGTLTFVLSPLLDEQQENQQSQGHNGQCRGRSWHHDQHLAVVRLTARTARLRPVAEQLVSAYSISEPEEAEVYKVPDRRFIEQERGGRREEHEREGIKQERGGS